MRFSTTISVVLACLFWVSTIGYAQEKAYTISSFQERVLKTSDGKKDPLLGEDKVHHLLASAYLAAVGYYLGRIEASWSQEKAIVFAAGFSFSFGLAKEIYDQKSAKGRASLTDLVADICGIALGILIIAESP